MRRSKQQWLDILNQQQLSGLSAAQFCRNENINQKYFSTRKIQLRKEVESSHSTFAKVNVIKPSCHETTIECCYKNSTLKLKKLPSAKWMAELLSSLS